MQAAESLAGRRVLITGAARRIGRVLALSLAEQGARVAITYRASRDEALTTVRELGQPGFAVRCDLDEESSIEQAVGEVVSCFGGLDLLINNAGAFESVPLEQISAAQWDAMFAANTRGPFLMSKAAYPHLKAANGRIIHIGSLGGLHPWATHAHYCASKTALHMLSQTMAKAWAPEISVNCVAPGMIVTAGEPGAAYAHFAEKTPMRRNGTSEDVAAAVLFFATAPRFITGQMLAVDGGLGL